MNDIISANQLDDVQGLLENLAEMGNPLAIAIRSLAMNGSTEFEVSLTRDEKGNGYEVRIIDTDFL